MAAGSRAKTLRDDLNVSLLVQSFETHLRAARKSPATIAHYVGATKQFLAFADAEHLPAVEHVTREHVELWLASLTHYATASVKNRYLGLRAFYDWLDSEGEIDRNPFGPVGKRRIKPPVLEETSKDVLTQAELKEVFTMLSKAKRWRDAAIVAIFYDTGIRASELATAKVSDLDPASGILTLERTKGKRLRWVQLSSETLVYLGRYHRRARVDDTYLVCGQRQPFTRSGLYDLVRRCVEQAGITKRVGPHDLRHTSATHTAESGLMSESDAMMQYGWQDPEMFRRYTEQARRRAALASQSRVGLMGRLK